MVSARPSPNPVRGRISYPTASPYTPGDVETSPYLDSEPVHPVSSRDSQTDRVQNLKTWWKGFRDKPEEGSSAQGVFGIPLEESISYASVQISTAGPDGRLYVWGVIPVVVAKCGLFLKENATEVEGTFRISGSAKRMRELQTLFETGPKYGKNIDWEELQFTTHDVATIFRRFLTQMPESVIPIDFYEEFRSTLDEPDAIERYKELIRAMPPVNQYLLLYVLDLLSVFARKADQNLMTAPNLALIFQPGMLSHPSHAMRPSEHVLSQHVLEFLIEHQDHFLVGMELKPKRKRHEKKATDSAPPRPLVKADDDLMLPSSSDDEVPDGGYYVFESQHPPQSPKVEQAPPSTPSALRSATPPLPPPPAHPIGDPAEILQPSDSDEDAPAGGYEVRVSESSQKRATMVARSKSKYEAPAQIEGVSEAGKNLSRRRTLPTKRIAGLTSRFRSSREV